MARRGETPPARDPGGIDRSLTALAAMLLSDHFFDPDL